MFQQRRMMQTWLLHLRSPHQNAVPLSVLFPKALILILTLHHVHSLSQYTHFLPFPEPDIYADDTQLFYFHPLDFS